MSFNMDRDANHTFWFCIQTEAVYFFGTDLSTVDLNALQKCWPRLGSLWKLFNVTNKSEMVPGTEPLATEFPHDLVTPIA
jgi:hypothetical protein